MDTSKPFASLSQTLLARKGGAKPAIRPHIVTTSNQDSLELNGDHGFGQDDGAETPISEVRHQQERIVRSYTGNFTRPPRERRSAFAHGGKAAFTLRLDEDRHLRLRLACTASGQSAQQVVTEALDKFLAELPELASPDFFAIAGELRRKRNN